MAERKTYTAEDFKGCNGRRVLVEATIYEEPDTGPGITLRFSPGRILPVLTSAIVEILPWDIKVGDLVSWSGGARCSVRFIDDEWAWVRDPVDSYIVPLSALTVVERA